VEEGFDAVLTRKHSPNSAASACLMGAAEAKLIALAARSRQGPVPVDTDAVRDKVVEMKIG